MSSQDRIAFSKKHETYARMNTYKFFEVFMLNNWICRTKQDYATF